MVGCALLRRVGMFWPRARGLVSYGFHGWVSSDVHPQLQEAHVTTLACDIHKAQVPSEKQPSRNIQQGYLRAAVTLVFRDSNNPKHTSFHPK